MLLLMQCLKNMLGGPESWAGFWYLWSGSRSPSVADYNKKMRQRLTGRCVPCQEVVAKAKQPQEMSSIRWWGRLRCANHLWQISCWLPCQTQRHVVHLVVHTVNKCELCKVSIFLCRMCSSRAQSAPQSYPMPSFRITFASSVT